MRRSQFDRASHSFRWATSRIGGKKFLRTICMTPDQGEELKFRAKAAQLSISAYVCRLLFPPPPGDIPIFPRNIVRTQSGAIVYILERWKADASSGSSEHWLAGMVRTARGVWDRTPVTFKKSEVVELYRGRKLRAPQRLNQGFARPRLGQGQV